MSHDDNLQWMLTREALLKLFGNSVSFPQAEGTRFEGVWISPSALPKMESCFSFLEEKTGMGRIIDPFQMADGTSWVILSQVLSRTALREMAFEVAVRYLRLCYQLQEKENVRMHKGAPLFWVSQRLYEMGRMEEAGGFHVTRLH